MIKLSNKIIFDKNSLIKLFILKIFYNFNDNYKNKKGYIDYIKNRAIFILKNEDVDSINEYIFPENTKEFLSANFVENKDEVHLNLYSVEFLNTLILNKILSYKLVLKKVILIILL